MKTDPDADPFVEIMLLLAALALDLTLPFARAYAILTVLLWVGYGPGPEATPIIAGGFVLSLVRLGIYVPQDKSAAWYVGRGVTIYALLAVYFGVAALVLS